jgi:colanic acid biosynthesis glycosyl transferase WcaI
MPTGLDSKMNTTQIDPPKARIMIICGEYSPEPGSTAVMITQLSRALAADGYAVTVLTNFPNRPEGRVYSGFRRKIRCVEEWEGVRVVRCPHWLIGPKRRHRDRILENITFGLMALVNALREPAPDLVIVDTWPILASQLGFLAGTLRKVPVLYYVQDVYPEIAIDTGVLNSAGWIARLLLRLDKGLFRKAAGAIAISETMKELLCTTRGVAPDRVEIIYNWVKEDFIRPAHRENAWRAKMGISADAFVLTYAGTVGLVSGADILLDVATKVAGADIQILCVGEGPLKEGMMEKAVKSRLSNLHFHDFQDDENFPLMLAAADAFLLPMRPGTRDASVPSKLISYLAAGRPVINATPAGAATMEIVTSKGAGLAIEAGNAEAISRAVRQLASDPGLSRELGRNARRAFEELFTFNKSYSAFKSLIESHVHSRPAGEDITAVPAIGQ